MAKMVLAGRIDFGNVFGLHFFLAERLSHTSVAYIYVYACEFHASVL